MRPQYSFLVQVGVLRCLVDPTRSILLTQCSNFYCAIFVSSTQLNIITQYRESCEGFQRDCMTDIDVALTGSPIACCTKEKKRPMDEGVVEKKDMSTAMRIC